MAGLRTLVVWYVFRKKKKKIDCGVIVWACHVLISSKRIWELTEEMDIVYEEDQVHMVKRSDLPDFG